jgi:hypothetical protein
VFRDRRLETLERDRIADDLDPPAVADELDALNARLERRGRERPDGAAGIHKQRRRRVLSLHRLRAPLRDARDDLGRPGEVAEQIKCVRRLVQQYAAALPPPRAAPVCCAVVHVRPVERVDDRCADERPQPAVVEQPSRGGDHRSEPLLEGDAEQLPRPLGGGDHRVGLARFDGERLLAQHVRAALQRHNGQLGVRGMRRCDDDDVEPLCEQLVTRAERTAGVFARACLRRLPVE